MERAVDFFRDRHMLCGHCGRRWVADLEWIDRWSDSQESCPGCGVTCEAEAGPRVTVDPDDFALQDDEITQFAWYHTSTHPDWPDFDPAASLNDDSRADMKSDALLDNWVDVKRAKALHVGTYEAAVENMLRRIYDHQDEPGTQFYLYRLHLVPTVAVRAGWIPDPGNWMGDVMLDEVCPPGVDVARYRNDREDAGGISLALGRTAILSVQRIEIPLLLDEDSGWVAAAVRELKEAGAEPPTSGVIRRDVTSPRYEKARELVAPLAERLPTSLGRQFVAATAFYARSIEDWAAYVIGLINIILAPEQALAWRFHGDLSSSRVKTEEGCSDLR
ncbi:hypothetical protein [Rhodococcus sp. SBT000017]|uniref:hypothetical protein n=1 Tax=Rhodococcus sp. SBT000017 TaxID=1803385 RepID=UPI0016052DEA|nr:hypothetical protein [Rhodococcus sp. SBT000017]